MSWAKAVVGWVNRVPPRARVAWLGVFFWAVSAVLPSVHRATQLTNKTWALLALSPLLLALGLGLFRPLPALASYVLLCGFPVSVALSMSRFDHELGLITYSPSSLSFSLLSLAAYATSACQLGAAHEQERSVEHKPLGEVPPVDAEGRKQTAGLVVLGAITAGGILSVFWGSWQNPAAYREHWGGAASTGAVTTALIAGLGAACAVAFVAPGLRAERKRSRREPSRLRKVVRPLLTALSFATLYLLSRER
ncbi:MAG TPA: hypothetical protein VFZ61_20340 [Polyangiales bacterium]